MLLVIQKHGNSIGEDTIESIHLIKDFMICVGGQSSVTIYKT